MLFWSRHHLKLSLLRTQQLFENLNGRIDIVQLLLWIEKEEEKTKQPFAPGEFACMHQNHNPIAIECSFSVSHPVI